MKRCVTNLYSNAFYNDHLITITGPKEKCSGRKVGTICISFCIPCKVKPAVNSDICHSLMLQDQKVALIPALKVIRSQGHGKIVWQSDWYWFLLANCKRSCKHKYLDIPVQEFGNKHLNNGDMTFADQCTTRKGQSSLML